MRRVRSSQPKIYSPSSVRGVCSDKLGFGVSAPVILARPHLLSGCSHKGWMRMITPRKLAGNVQYRKEAQGGSKSTFYLGTTQISFPSRVKLFERNPISCVPLEHKSFNCNSTSDKTLPVQLGFFTLLGHCWQCQYENLLLSEVLINIYDIWTNNILPKGRPRVPWLCKGLLDFTGFATHGKTVCEKIKKEKK